MKKLTLTLVALFLWATTSEAQIMLKTDKELEVGSNPVGVFCYDPPEEDEEPDSVVSIFCAGVDVNSNGIIDPEDEPPSWWKYNTEDMSSKAYKVSDFEYFFKKPYTFALNNAWGAYSVVANFMGYEEGSEKATLTYKSRIDLRTENAGVSRWSADKKLLHYYSRHNVSAYIIEGGETDTIISTSPYPELKESLKGKFVRFISAFSYSKHPDYGVYMARTFLSILSVKDGELWVEKYEGDYSTPPTLKKTDEEKLMDFNPETDTISSITNNFQIILKSSDPNQVKYKFHYNLPEGEKLLPYDDELPTYITGFETGKYVLVTDDRNIVIKNFYPDKGVKGDFEMHRSNFEIGYIFKRLDYVFVCNKYKNEKHKGKIAIYDHINDDQINYTTQDWTYVGYQPVATFISDDTNRNIYTLCQGIDYNFNGKIEEELGDVAPSLWKSYLDYAGKFTSSEKVTDIDFKINLPMKTSISPDGNLLIPSGNKVIIYSREKEKVVDEIDLGMYVISIDVIEDLGDIYYLFGLRDYSTGKSYARVISKTANYDKSIETSENIVDAKFERYNLYNLVVTLNEGDYEDSKSNLEFILFHTAEVRKEKNIELEGVGSRISFPKLSDRIYPIMTASHKIHIIHKSEQKHTSTINTDTEGSGGPRDIEIDDFYWFLYTTTYSNEIQMYDMIDGAPYNRYDKLGTGFTEGLNKMGHNFIIAENIQYTFNDPSNRIYSYNTRFTNVDGDVNRVTTPPIRIYPHPFGNEFHMVSDELVGQLEITIIDGQGKIVVTHSAVADGEVAMSADELGLGAGNYTAIINGTKAVRFIVIK